MGGGRSWAVLAIVCLAAGSAEAQQRGFRVDRYPGTASPDDLIWVERAGILGDNAPFARLTLAYSDDPLVTRAGDGAQTAALIEDQIGLHLSLGLSLIDRVHLAVLIPIYVQSTRAAPADLEDPLRQPDDGGAGDPAIDARFTVLDQDAPLELAFAATLRIPVGNANALAADETFTAIPRVIASRGFGDEGGYASASAGIAVREEVDYGDLTIGNELVFAAGLLVPVADGFGVTAEVAGSTVLADAFSGAHTPLEATLGARYDADVGLTGAFGVGAGLTQGYGSPDIRLMAVVGYAPPERPIEPEPPPPEDPDRDDDGVPNRFDRCPDDAEDLDDFDDDDGCPDPDNDGDRIPDGDDGCATEPEDRDDYQDADGCPDADNDSDGVPDTGDGCILEGEDRDGFRDADGCPDPDNDGDGILDAGDRCPLEPETMNQIEDDDGCPDLIRIDRETRQIVILEPVYFATRRDTILDRSFPMLEEMARILAAQPELGRISIDGHTDSAGRDSRNLDLSNRRAESVMRWLVAHGIPAERLEAHGFGETRPVADNATVEGRARNRRVEFRLVDLPEPPAPAPAPTPAPAPAPEPVPTPTPEPPTTP